MQHPLTPQPIDWPEGRRLRAWDLHQQGWTPAAIAAALGVTPGAVSQWLGRAQRGGAQALRRRVVPGPAPKLTAGQRAQLPTLLVRGAEAFGFRGEVWTTGEIVALLEKSN